MPHMDNAVALVQAYLRLNGYFTVTEFPVIEAIDGGGHRSVTDIDVLAFRFPNAGRLVPARTNDDSGRLVAADPELDLHSGRSDMIIGEVKEGRAELNRGATHPSTLRAVLTRFGCCHPDAVDHVARNLTEKGRADIDKQHRVRLVAFGTSPPDNQPTPHHVIELKHVITFLTESLTEHWDVLRHAEFKDRGLGFVALLQKAGLRIEEEDA